MFRNEGLIGKGRRNYKDQIASIECASIECARTKFQGLNCKDSIARTELQHLNCKD